MSEKICDMNCFECKFSDCINDGVLSEKENRFSVDYETSLKSEIRQEIIRQIDNPKARAVAKYRQTQKGKETVHRMNTNELAKARFKKYEQSEKGISRRRRYEATPERKAYKKNYMSTYNKEYQSVKRDRKELKRMEEAKLFLDILLKEGSVSVCDGRRNRPRERQKYERVLKVISESELDISVELNVDRGLVERRF